MKTTIHIVWGLGLALIGSQAEARECSVEIELAAHAQVIDLQLEPEEFPMASLMLLPGNRVATATGVLSGGKGARFIVANTQTGEIETTIEMPTLEGRPAIASVVARSNSGANVLATGGFLSGGPALLYETAPAMRYLNSHQLKNSRLHSFVDLLFNLIQHAARGDRFALGQLSRRFPGHTDGLLEFYRSEPENFYEELLGVYGRTSSAANAEPVPVVSVEFHPDGSKFLLSSSENVSIRNTGDGRTLHDIALRDINVPFTLAPPRVFFSGGGDQVLALSLKALSLWDVRSSSSLDVHVHNGDLADGEFVNSPNAEFFSYAVQTENQSTREVWTVVPSDESPEGRKFQRVASYQQNEVANRTQAPSIAFSGKTVYAVGKSDGIVELHDMKTHALLPQGEIHVGTPEERSQLDSLEVAIDYSGKWLVVSGRANRGNFLELWSVENKKGVRLRVPPPAVPGRSSYLSAVEFDPRGEWFSFYVNECEEISDGPEADRELNSTPYVVDVYKAIAKAITQPN